MSKARIYVKVKLGIPKPKNVMSSEKVTIASRVGGTTQMIMGKGLLSIQWRFLVFFCDVQPFAMNPSEFVKFFLKDSRSKKRTFVKQDCFGRVRRDHEKLLFLP